MTLLNKTLKLWKCLNYFFYARNSRNVIFVLQLYYGDLGYVYIGFHEAYCNSRKHYSQAILNSLLFLSPIIMSMALRAKPAVQYNLCSIFSLSFCLLCRLQQCAISVMQCHIFALSAISSSILYQYISRNSTHIFTSNREARSKQPLRALALTFWQHRTNVLIIALKT